MQRITERGIQVLIPPDTSRRRTTRRNRDGGRYAEMRQVLASDHGGELGSVCAVHVCGPRRWSEFQRDSHRLRRVPLIRV
jgi:hypothetical protein